MHDFSLFVIDIDQVLFISLFLTPFDLFNFHPTLKPKLRVILRSRFICTVPVTVTSWASVKLIDIDNCPLFVAASFWAGPVLASQGGYLRWAGHPHSPSPQGSSSPLPDAMIQAFKVSAFASLLQ